MNADPAILAASRLLENAAYKIPAAIRHLRRQQLTLDGMPTTASGADHGARGGGRTIAITHHDDPTIPEGEADHIPVTSVEAAALNQIRIVSDATGDLKAHMRGILVMVAELNQQLDRIIGPVAIPKPTRCDPSGRDGALEWGDYTCTDAPVKGALCGRCYMREYRWRQEHGLPSRAEPGIAAM